MITLFLINGLIVAGLAWIIGILVKDALTNRTQETQEAVRQAQMPRWARSNS